MILEERTDAILSRTRSHELIAIRAQHFRASLQAMQRDELSQSTDYHTMNWTKAKTLFGTHLVGNIRAKPNETPMQPKVYNAFIFICTYRLASRHPTSFSSVVDSLRILGSRSCVQQQILGH